MSTITKTREQVKAGFMDEVSRLFDRLMGRADHPDEDVFLDLEVLAGRGGLSAVKDMLAAACARACEAAMEADLAERGLGRDDVSVRLEKDYFAYLSTTFGVVVFPWFAYRWSAGDRTGMAFKTENPARRLLPYYRSCRSSPLCLEWEIRLGSRDAFRRAQQMLKFVTRGALDLEDTTIERHMVAASKLVDPKWLYRRPEDIRRTLRERATRDKKTNRPIIYASTDGHALRRYIDDTWAWGWMVVNGIRLWCEDARTGAIIHLGGEFTWGDCRAVAARFRELIEAGILPNDTPVWKELNAQLVFVSDGAEWIPDHVLPLLPDAFVILDPFHVVGWVAALGAKLFGAGTNESKEFHSSAWEAVFGEPRPRRSGANQKRKGHKKRPRGERRTHSHDRYRALVSRLRHRSPDATLKALIDLLGAVADACDQPEPREEIEKIAARITNNALRMQYSLYLNRGFQVGSGAMESLHRSASQPRLKRSGRWLQETSQAVLQFRMLELSERWDEFWSQRDLAPQLAGVFTPNTEHPEPPQGPEDAQPGAEDANPVREAA
jgi:hypothetical protein